MSLLFLVDKSALARGLDLDEQWPDDDLCLCPVTRLEMLFSARSAADHAALEDALDSFRHLKMDAHTFAAAESAQRELAATGEHRIPIPDLLIAACAQQHGADVIHVDRHFDTLAKVLGFHAVRAN